MQDSVRVEAQLASALGSGRREEDSLEHLLEEHFELVFRFFSRRVPSVEDAQDLSAETFLAALQSRRPRNVEPACWLYGIARRKLADAVRRWRRDKSRIDRYAAALSTQPPSDDAAELRGLVEKLPTDQRDALLLQTLENLAIVEISAVMGRSQGSVKALLQRAKERIRRESSGQFQPEVQR